MIISFLSALLMTGTAFAQLGSGGTTSTTAEFSSYFSTVERVSPTEANIYVGRTFHGCTSVDNVTPCNSCAGLGSAAITDGNLVCNQSEVYPTLDFVVTLATQTAAAYQNPCPDKAIVMRATGAATTNFTFPRTSSQTGYTVGGVGEPVTVAFTWTSIFAAMGNDGITSAAKTLEFGFNSACGDTTMTEVALKLNVKYRYIANSHGQMNFPCKPQVLEPYPYEGICSFRAERGDEKIYLTDIGAPSGSSITLLASAGNGTNAVTPDASGMSYNRLRIFCRPGNGSPHTVNAQDVCTDLTIDGRTLKNAKIEGLQNGVQYELLAANVDQAGNVTLMSNPVNVGTLGVATPAPVNGLLDGKSCFIATAAFGSPMEEHVVRFRKFRDEVLLKNSLGRQFVEFYYEYSPDAARFIASNEVLRAVTRFLLYPVLFFAEMAMKFGFLFPIFLGLFIFGVIRAQRTRIRRGKA